MNYDVTARVLVNELNDRYYISPRDSSSTPFDLQSAIAAALRRAANEAASAILDDLDKCWSFDSDQQHTHTWHTKQDFMQKHRPEGGTR